MHFTIEQKDQIKQTFEAAGCTVDFQMEGNDLTGEEIAIIKNANGEVTSTIKSSTQILHN